MVASIPEMNKKLEELNSYFSEQTEVLTKAIYRHEAKFTERDHM
jgi:hypothetical protein